MLTRRTILDAALSTAAAGLFVRAAAGAGQTGAAKPRRIMVFDVNETLLDVGALAPFERSFSVDPVRRFKPAAEVYRLVATELHVAPARLRLVAAHAWDVLGAMRAGCAAAFIARPGKALFPLADKPDIIGRDLRDVAGQIIKSDTAG